MILHDNTHHNFTVTHLPHIFNKAMKLAVTGASGSVGKRVVKLALERGHSVIGTDTTKPSSQDPWTNTSKYVFKTSDLTDFDNVLEVLAGCDAVINLAGHPNPLDYKVKTHNKCVIIKFGSLCPLDAKSCCIVTWLFLGTSFVHVQNWASTELPKLPASTLLPWPTARKPGSTISR